MIKKIFSSKKGEGYVDICIATVIFVMLTVIALNIFSFITLKNDMDQIADNLIIAATHSGEFGEDFSDVDMDMIDNYFYYELDYGAEEFFTSGEKVQLGDRMWVEIWVDTSIKGLGIFEIPVTVKVKRFGISEAYWK
ncbi:MAG: DUF4320 family protein [Acutalibacteraceae bacterium]|nr:DUF4320 family protein [Acutalibacteraceae bacterium]